MSRIGMSAILVVVFAAFVVSAILHDDEVGQRDWKYSGIGRVELAAFVTTPSVKQTIVASEEGFVAALSTLDKGDIRWRHSLGEAQVCLSADASGTLVTSARGVGHLLETSTGQLTAAFSVDLTGLTNGRVTDCFYSGASRTINVVAVGGTTVRVYSFKADYNALAGEPVVATHTFTVSSAATNAKVAGLVNVWVERNGTGVDVWSFGSKEVTTTDTMGWLLETSTNGNIVMSFYKDNTSPKDPEAGHALRVMSAEGKVIKATDKGTACKECRSGFAKAEEADASGSLVITIREQPDTFALLVASRRFNVASKGNYPPRVIAARQTSKKADVLLRASNGHLLLVTATLDSDSAIVAWERFEGLSSPAHVKVAPLNDFSSKVDGVEVPSTNPSDVFGFNVDIIVLSTYGTLYRVPVASKGAEILVVADLTESVRKALDIVCICGITFKDLSIGDDGVATVVVQFKQETLVLTVGLTTGVITLASPPTLNALFLSSKAIVNADGVKVFGESVKAGSQYLYKVDRTTGKASGFKIPAGSSQSIPTWEVSFGPNIVAVAEPKDRLAVLSADHLRVFPNVTKINEVRRKYPTQNVAVVATVDDEDVLSVFIFDTLSGSILAVTRHNDVRGAVHAIIVEHVVVYHFLNADRMRYAVGVMELFEHEDVIVNEGTTASPALAVSSFFVSQKTFSPLTSRPPVVASMVLSFPAGAVRSLGVTSSFQGISRKQIIFALANGHVHAVDLRALCFGGQTNPAKPEEIIRHVNLPSVHIISHVYDVAQPRIVATTPTELESSSHVAVAGVDLLYVRVSAGKAFDMLNDDFNHRGLILVCAALGVLSIVARYFAARKSLLLAWA